MKKIIIKNIAFFKTTIRTSLALPILALPILFITQVSLAQLMSTKVEMNTSEGKIVIQLNDEKSPITVANFLKYVNDKFYDGLIFHRVINDFMIQGGGVFPDMTIKPATYPSIENEAPNGLSNLRGTIAMARFSPPNSAKNSFFINVVDNKRLDHFGLEPAQYGYAVFGQVVEGMDVVDKIKVVKTGSVGQFNDVPETSIVINTVRVLPPQDSK